ncbi:WYL domain-containing protein [Dyella solisilvae]|uniref:WYL domain-containing protein n=1 Tax=Dyella solisilvae TaxID=1920168 RepID=A0A370K8H5_9GAMM|nr:WYL domain-containing protein [Dyella solisilvae]RDI98943.1 WYL domain-containing protein [Dyella solisilvae]
MRQETERTLARQWALLRCMPPWPRKATVGDLMAALEDRKISVTRRTVERDLQALSQQFPLAVDDKGKPYGWCWAKGANQEFTPRLTTSQSVALLLARVHLRTLLPRVMLKELIPLFDSAEQEVAATGWKHWHRETAVIPSSLALLPPTIGRGVMECVQEALARGCCLSGRYRSKGSTAAKELTVHPLGLIVRGPVHYLVATLYDYADVRQLALHRLSHTEVLATPRKKPPRFDFQKYAAEAAKYNSQGLIRLVAHFDQAAAEHLRETPLSPDQTIKALDDGSRLEVEATVENDETLRWWLLGFGDMVEVRQPRSLRKELRDHAEGMWKAYTDAKEARHPDERS